MHKRSQCVENKTSCPLSHILCPDARLAVNTPLIPKRHSKIGVNHLGEDSGGRGEGMS
jgi:hypothetical protein